MFEKDLRNARKGFYVPEPKWEGAISVGNLPKKGVTLSLLWTEYCAEADAAGLHPYMSTQLRDNDYSLSARSNPYTSLIER